MRPLLAAILIVAYAVPAAAEHAFCTRWRDGDASERLRLALKFARQTPEEVRQCVLEGLIEGALDDWVAGLCKYRRYHRDYAMLLEIPKRLRAHADRLAADATRETEALAKIESDALAADGVPALEESLAASYTEDNDTYKRH